MASGGDAVASMLSSGFTSGRGWRVAGNDEGVREKSRSRDLSAAANTAVSHYRPERCRSPKNSTTLADGDPALPTWAPGFNLKWNQWAGIG